MCKVKYIGIICLISSFFYNIAFSDMIVDSRVIRSADLVSFPEATNPVSVTLGSEGSPFDFGANSTGVNYSYNTSTLTLTVYNIPDPLKSKYVWLHLHYEPLHPTDTIFQNAGEVFNASRWPALSATGDVSLLAVSSIPWIPNGKDYYSLWKITPQPAEEEVTFQYIGPEIVGVTAYWEVRTICMSGDIYYNPYVVPEPSTGLLIGAGLLCITLYSRSKNRKMLVT